MSLLDYIKSIRKSGERYFTIEKLMADLCIGKNAALNAIHRVKKKGELISPSKGLYVIVPPEHMVHGSIPAEELIPIIMNHLNADYYVGLLSAAGFYGASHQKTFRFQVITNARIVHPLEFGQIKIEIVRRKVISDLPLRDFTVNTGYLKVASPELIAIDLLEYVHRCGGLNHVVTVLSELIESMDADRLIKLACDMEREHQLQRIGYIVDNIELMDEDLSRRFVEKIHGYISGHKGKYLPLSSSIVQRGFPRCKKWRIVINTEIESDV